MKRPLMLLFALVLSGLPGIALAQLDATETEYLLLMREEEKLARDVYHAMHELYGQRVFTNIARAEQRHMDAILGLLDAYGLNDPCKEAGRFGNQELQKLYDMLVAGGRKSREEAFLIGALIEEVDIADLMEAMAHTDKDEIHSVYSALLGGSKRHLNAFVRNYESVSQKPYQAQNLMQEQVDEIIGR